jgi:hypothetical protein
VKERDTTVRKHVHRWKLTEREEPADSFDPFGMNWFHPVTPRAVKPPVLVTTLHRKCEDCMKKQIGEVPDTSVLVPGYENIADIDWKDV